MAEQRKARVCGTGRSSGARCVDSFVKLDPRTMMKNPVMFVVEVGSVITTVLLFARRAHELRIQSADHAVAVVHRAVRELRRSHGRRPRQSAGRHAAQSPLGNRWPSACCTDGTIETVPSSKLRSGDVVMVAAGEFIPGDGEVIEGVASVDESAITGESAPVIRESGGDRSAVTGGTRVLSDEIKVRITSNPGETFLDRMIALVEGAERQKTPNEIALNILLAGLTIIFLLAVVTLQPFAIYSGSPQTGICAGLAAGLPDSDDHRRLAFGDRHRGHGSADSAQRARHVRAARWKRRATSTRCCSTRPERSRSAIGRRRSLFLRRASPRAEMADAAQLSSLADETPEGRSIVVLAKEKYGLRGRELASHEADIRSVHRADPHVGREPERPSRFAKARSTPSPTTWQQNGTVAAARGSGERRADRALGRHAAGGRGESAARWA